MQQNNSGDYIKKKSVAGGKETNSYFDFLGEICFLMLTIVKIEILKYSILKHILNLLVDIYYQNL